jgi:serine/threonine-protein kinase RsbW
LLTEKKQSCQFASDLNLLMDVLSWFEGLNQPFIPTKVWLQCQLAIAEGFTNAVRHAHQNLPIDTPIDLEVTINTESHSLTICIWDCGQPFDLGAKVQELPHLFNDQSEGGRGIAIMNEIADDISYIRTDDQRNCLILVKSYMEEV